jgi:hypothetical protein
MRVYVLLMLLLLICLPLVGILLAGKPVLEYLEFPPLTRYVEHAPFSWLGFALLAAVNLAMLVPLVLAVVRTPLTEPSYSAHPAQPARSFPWWGWGGLALTAAAWVVAWSRCDEIQALQPFTFSPLWLGYIVVINALTYRRTGHCMLLDRPRYVLLLFPVSAGLWWFFEYLNRFVQNWYYIGIDEFGPIQYLLYATPPFATVLPAVLGTKEWLESSPRLQRALRRLRPVQVQYPRAVGWITLLVAMVGLMGIGVWPDYLYPLLWVSPRLIITALQAISGQETIFSGTRHGDWRPIAMAALAALICGFFWEMWNYYSAAKWVYAVPYVHRFLIFEMPLLGFGGYLPFGLECAVMGSLISNDPTGPPR